MKILVSILCAATLCLALGADARAALPGLDAAQADFNKGAYPQCLQKLAQLMPQAKPDSSDRFDVLMLRGECLLHLKQRKGAATAFEAAATVAKRQRDLPTAAKATALAALVNASGLDLTYPPKPKGTPEPSTFEITSASFDIVDAAPRQKAMAALLDDTRARLKQRISKAMNDSSLKPTDNLLPDVWELYAIETAATGDATGTSKTIEALGDHIHELLAADLKRVAGRVDQLQSLGSEPIWINGVVVTRGLQVEEREELGELKDSLEQAEAAAENARRIAKLFGRTGEKWDALLNDCDDVRDDARKAYERR